MDEASIEVLVSREAYPVNTFISDDGIYTVPFNLLPGEGGLFRGRTSEGILILTEYRLYHTEGTFFNIPVGLIDYIECRDIFYLYIYCKDGRSFRCIFDNTDETQKWFKRIQNGIKVPDKVDDQFGFRSFAWTGEEQKEGIASKFSTHDLKEAAFADVTAEAERMGFDLNSVWKISRVNEDYQLCPSYPPYIIVPTSVHDEHVKDLATFRYSRRIPAVVWRHQQNGCIIARSSQPRMGILSWRNANDEKLIQAISDACTSDPGYEIKVNGKEESYSLQSDLDGDGSLFCSQDQVKPTQKKLLIVDARSYAAAMTNRAKGGGYECDGYYSNCEIQYMGLANIHTIRNSFACVRALCAAPDDSWLSSLENTKWLHHISGLIRAALLVVNSVDVEKRPVLVHCSDGWDRTPQIVALAEIMLDPYYRTKKGFQVLVEREWLQFGHKFADRCGQSGGTEDRNERSPVFIQWLDCIYQLLEQFECHFEFNQQYLARLVLHTYSCLFGTFLCNTDQSRNAYKVSNRTFSVWPVLNEKSQFHNYLFNHSNEVLRPSYHIRNLKFWSDVYLPNNSVSLGRSTLPPVEEPLPEENVEKTNLVKTKSCDNIPCAEHSLTLQRRNSDPNLVENTFMEPVLYPHIPEYTEKILTHNSNIMENSVLSNLCNGFGADRSELDDLERTGSKSFGISHSNLVLKEPTIDGSTDTLVSENGALVQEQCRNESSHINNGETFSYSKLACSVSTSTTDLPLTVEGVLQSMTQNISYIDSRLPNWCQNVIGACISNKRNSDSSNSCSCSYTTPNHSRTPSSGFPATPCDEPSDMPTLKKDSSIHQTLDVDGLTIVPNAVQERIKKLILHYKNKVANLQYELSSARCEFFQHIYRYYQVRDGHGIDADDAFHSSPFYACGQQYHSSAVMAKNSYASMVHCYRLSKPAALS